MSFLQNLFEYLNQSCNYAVLRSFDELPESYNSHDIDMIITEKEYNQVKSMLYKIARKHDFRLIQYYRDERFATIFLQKIINDVSEMIELDFFFSMSAKGILMMNADNILQNRVFNGKVFHVCLTDEVLDKCLCNGVFGVPYPEKYMSRYQSMSKDDVIKLNKKLQKVFGSGITSFEAQQKVSGKDLSRKAMINGIKLRGLKQLIFWVRHIFFKIKNVCSPKGIFVSITGPDGSGKTTVLDIIERSYEFVFRGSILVYHFRPDVLPRIAELFHKAGLKDSVDEEYDKPHRGKASGILGSAFRLIYYIIDYQIGYLVKIRAQLFRRKIIIYDRYYTDIVADSLRSNISLPFRIINKLGLIVPQPKFNILLTASPETIAARKQELNGKEIKEINARLEYLSKLKGKKIFYNEGSAEESASEIMNWILEVQDKKLCKLMGKRVKNG